MSSFTQKHYRIIYKQMEELLTSALDPPMERDFMFAHKKLGDAFQKDNPNFKRKLWVLEGKYWGLNESNKIYLVGK